jgi:hypothetical protein
MFALEIGGCVNFDLEKYCIIIMVYKHSSIGVSNEEQVIHQCAL